MTPRAMVATAILLGAFVAAAGAYALLYCASRLSERPVLRIARDLSYVALCASAGVLVGFTPLHLGWKVLLAASCAVYLMIPPVTFRYLKRLHRGENASHATGLAQHADRRLPGLFRGA